MSGHRIMIDKTSGLKVHSWKTRDQTGASICIRYGNFFLNIPMHHSRALVDAVHDIADQQDAELRKEHTT